MPAMDPAVASSGLEDMSAKENQSREHVLEEEQIAEGCETEGTDLHENTQSDVAEDSRPANNEIVDSTRDSHTPDLEGVPAEASQHGHSCAAVDARANDTEENGRTEETANTGTGDTEDSGEDNARDSQILVKTSDAPINESVLLEHTATSQDVVSNDEKDFANLNFSDEYVSQNYDMENAVTEFTDSLISNIAVDQYDTRNGDAAPNEEDATEQGGEIVPDTEVSKSNKLETPKEFDEANSSNKIPDNEVCSNNLASDLNAEKERVQSLIYSLIDRVCQEPDSATEPVVPATQEDVSDSAGNDASDAIYAQVAADESPAKITGVPYGDARAYCVRGQGTCENSESGFVKDLFWTQTLDCTTLTVVLDFDPPPTARDVRVEFGHTSVLVQVGSSNVLEESLHHPICYDDCLWSLDTSNRHGQSLILELEKAKLVWWPVLFTCHDPSTYKPYDQTCAAAARGITPPPTLQSTDEQFGDAESTSEPRKASSPEYARTDESRCCTKSDSERNEGIESQEVNNIEKVDLDLTEISNNESERNAVSEDTHGVDEAEQGIGKSNLDRIIAQYRAAFESKESASSEAALQLASFYQHGIGVRQDNSEAAKLYRYALEHGVLDSTAAFQLGLIYNQGCDGILPDAKEAVRWWIVAARLGNAVAMFNLGVMYMNGSGCDMDPQRAMQFFKQANALNPQLRPPELSSSQFAERVAKAAKVKKLRRKAELSDEDRQRRHDQGLEIVRYAMFGTVAVVTISITAVFVRNWWRNRL